MKQDTGMFKEMVYACLKCKVEWHFAIHPLDSFRCPNCGTELYNGHSNSVWVSQQSGFGKVIFDENRNKGRAIITGHNKPKGWLVRLAEWIMIFCDCGCHYHEKYGWVVMAGCRWHD